MQAKSNSPERGFALVTVLMLTALLVTLLSAYFFTTKVQMSTNKSSMDSSTGFYASEAGVNARAESIRSIFVGYNRPTGTSPVITPGVLPCEPGAMGTGDYACQSFDFEGRDVRTYMTEDPGNPLTVILPPGSLYANLTAQEYAYEVTSMALNKARPEAILGMRFKSVLVPLFQFAAFYNKDLEILPGPAMTFAGPVHSNGNLFLDAGTSQEIQGQVTTAGDLYRGRKNDAGCSGAPVSIWDTTSTPVQLPSCSGGRTQIMPTDVENDPPTGTHDWDGRIRMDVEFLNVPPPESRDPVPGEIYWDKADARIVLDLRNPADERIKIFNQDLSEDLINTPALLLCAGTPVDQTRSTDPQPFYNNRESTDMELLDVDVEALMNCIETNPGVMGGKALDDTTEGGLVWYLTVFGPAEAGVNNYGVRLKNGEELAPTSGVVQINGLTVVSNQAVYVQGNYNSDPNWKPAAVMADSLNVLSEAWDDANSGLNLMPNADPTQVYAAFLSGTDTTGGPGGEGAFSPGNYNGGLENYPRFHENWTGDTLTYRGSFVSLDQPQHVSGTWGDQVYSPPIRDWGYDTRFNDASNLPPLSPRFVYLTHDLFIREYDY